MKMSRMVKHTRTFALIGILATVVGYLFLVYRGYTLNEEIESKRDTLQRINEEIIRVTKSRDEIRVRYQQVDLKYQYGLSVGDSIDLPANQEIIRRSDSANRLLEVIRKNHPLDTQVTISYYSRTAETEKITLSLKALPYEVSTKTQIKEMMRNVPTNSVWFGRNVHIADVKVIALALIRAGIPVKAIRPFRNTNPNYKANRVEIGGDARIEQLSIAPYTVHQIDTATRFQRITK